MFMPGLLSDFFFPAGQILFYFFRPDIFYFSGILPCGGSCAFGVIAQWSYIVCFPAYCFFSRPALFLFFSGILFFFRLPVFALRELLRLRRRSIIDQSSIIDDQSSIIDDRSWMIHDRSWIIHDRSWMIHDRSWMIHDRSSMIDD